MIHEQFFLNIDESWEEILKHSLSKLSNYYYLIDKQEYLPNNYQLFNAFSISLHKTKYILFGESPYPREKSAIGYSFIDGAVSDIWGKNGLSKEVNKATSLRNFIKMLLVSKHYIDESKLSKESIASIDKKNFITNIDELKNNFLNEGFLLLNASLTLNMFDTKTKDAKFWTVFIQNIINSLALYNPDVEIILFGNIAKKIKKLDNVKFFKIFECEHPYNISFISNPKVTEYFSKFNLLEKNL